MIGSQLSRKTIMFSSILGVLRGVHPSFHKLLGKYSGLFVLGMFVCGTPAGAQDRGELVASLVDRVGILEEEARNLRGEVEEARHEITLLKKSLETLNADVDFRLKGSGDSADSSRGLPHEMSDASPPRPNEQHELGAMSPPSLPSLEEKEVVSTVEEEYERARSFLEQGDYPAAEEAFSSFLKDHEKHERASAALYWMGVTHFLQNQYEKAASTFAKVYKDYPKSIKAPDSLLKLARALGELDRKTDACTALDQLSKEYAGAFREEVAAERSKYNCK